MSFLDNSGDIILDAVLTDTGRMRMAKGDGSFRIVKFALGDDEINYELFNKDHASGSAYYDLDLMQTPVLEAFTDNAASMKSKLISIPRNNLLYLPVLKLNEGGGTGNTTRDSTRGTFIIAVDAEAQTAFSNLDGALFGETPASGINFIRLDQGLDTSEISPSRAIDPLLSETMYQIDIDNRLGSIVSTTGTKASISFVDDDNIATYFLSLGTDTEFVEENTDTTTDTVQTIAGPRGTMLKFMVQSSLELNTSDYYFTTIGTSAAIADNDGDTTYNIIKSTIRVIGVNTGYRLDIPVEFVKKP
tara:strand:- start:46 stop:954 length:909 start_codon:yes stop_codon:yes gene_type:complete